MIHEVTNRLLIQRKPASFSPHPWGNRPPSGRYQGLPVRLGGAVCAACALCQTRAVRRGRYHDARDWMADPVASERPMPPHGSACPPIPSATTASATPPPFGCGKSAARSCCSLRSPWCCATQASIIIGIRSAYELPGSDRITDRRTPPDATTTPLIRGLAPPGVQFRKPLLVPPVRRAHSGESTLHSFRGNSPSLLILKRT